MKTKDVVINGLNEEIKKAGIKTYCSECVTGTPKIKIRYCIKDLHIFRVDGRFVVSQWTNPPTSNDTRNDIYTVAIADPKSFEKVINCIKDFMNVTKQLTNKYHIVL